MDKNINYYKILNVSHNSDQKEIKANYRLMSKQLHPDKGGDEKYFKLISDAYKVLTTKREDYDITSKHGAKYNSMFELLEFEFTPHESGDKVVSKKDMFRENEMLHVVVKLKTFKNSITYKRNVLCSKCEGSGKGSPQNMNLNISDEALEILGMSKNGEGFNIFNEDIECDLCVDGEFNGIDCPVCHGSGIINLGLSSCGYCDGKGLRNIIKTVKLNLDNFIDGKMMLPHHGNHSKYDGKMGNLYVIIEDLLPLS